MLPHLIDEREEITRVDKGNSVEETIWMFGGQRRKERSSDCYEGSVDNAVARHTKLLVSFWRDGLRSVW